MMNRTPKTLLATALTAVVVLSMVASAMAVVPGRNGRIAFTSGREGANDDLAQLYMVDGFGGPGSLSSPFTPVGGQSRHPSWSPDRTKVVYANGTPGSPQTEEYDLFVKDMVTGSITALDLLEIGDGLSSDHPAWSPDGTKIAYEHQPTDNSAERDIKVKTFGTSKPAENVTSGAPVEFKPAWRPDSQTLLYARTSTGPPVNHDIYEKSIVGGAAEPIEYDPDFDEYQPAVSPDGTQFCYTRQSQPGNPATAEIFVQPLVGNQGVGNLSNDASRGDINCAWSPDGKKIAYVSGVFSQGSLVTKRADDAVSAPTPLADDEGSNNFDGNPDWAPDGSPDCPDRTVTTRPNTPITIELECTDTGPEYERTDPNGTVTAGGQPRSGQISDEEPTANPSTARYTPNPGFTGVDRIAYTAFDRFGFATDEGTITISVEVPGTGGGPGGAAKPGAAKPRCGGRTATIVGTAGNDRITGTRRRDVIVAGAGNDRVNAGRGSDLVCGGSGRDRLSGGRGNDRLAGDAGRDRLSGGSGRDRLQGGRGRDACLGGSGRDRTSACERRRGI